jgi:Cortical protein marker for cell polarity
VISLVISLFLILLLVIGGLIAARIRRKKEGYVQALGTPPIREESLERIPPSELLGDLEGRRQGYAVV